MSFLPCNPNSMMLLRDTLSQSDCIFSSCIIAQCRAYRKSIDQLALALLIIQSQLEDSQRKEEKFKEFEV